MPTDRLRSIGTMFGGGNQYVGTLNVILGFVDTNDPTTDELIGWHRGTLQNVSSEESTLRRVGYLRDIGFLRKESDFTIAAPAVNC